MGKSNKTTASAATMEAWFKGFKGEAEQRQARDLAARLEKWTGEPAIRWGRKIVGFGKIHYTYASGREGDWFLTGLAKAPKGWTLYFPSLLENHLELLEKIGPHSRTKSCLHVKDPGALDESALKKLVQANARALKKTYPSKR